MTTLLAAGQLERIVRRRVEQISADTILFLGFLDQPRFIIRLDKFL
jgi:hypothetical protein